MAEHNKTNSSRIQKVQNEIQHLHDHLLSLSNDDRAILQDQLDNLSKISERDNEFLTAEDDSPGIQQSIVRYRKGANTTDENSLEGNERTVAVQGTG